jgi:hypothetical protein
VQERRTTSADTVSQRKAGQKRRAEAAREPQGRIPDAEDKPPSCTTGELFPDGTLIELVAGSSHPNKPDLLLWNGKKAEIGPIVSYGGTTYEAPVLNPVLYRALNLPANCRDYVSARALFDQISKLFVVRLGMSRHQSDLLACFTFSSWLASRLPMAPGLLLTGSDEDLGVTVLRLLGCVCRHPILLAQASVSGLRSLPWYLSPTLLLNQETLRPDLRRLLRASSHHLHLSGAKGDLIDLYGSKAVFCGDSVDSSGLDAHWINATMPSSSTRENDLDEQVYEEIATLLQPQLLMYRLRNLSTLSDPKMSLSRFASKTRKIARVLSMCFPENSKLAEHAVGLLEEQDRDIHAERFFDIEYAIIEILLGLIHEDEQQKISVQDLTDKINALLRTRGERYEYSAENIGWKLRELEIPRHNSNTGRQISLRAGTSRRLHAFAVSMDLILTKKSHSNCADCRIFGVNKEQISAHNSEKLN